MIPTLVVALLALGSFKNGKIQVKCQAPRSNPLGLVCELDPSSSCLVMCFDKVDANMMNLAHKLSENITRYSLKTLMPEMSDTSVCTDSAAPLSLSL